MIQSFAYDALPGRVVFGEGALSRLAREVDTLGFKRALVLTTPQQTEQGDAAAAIFGPRAAGRFSKARMHVPVDIVDEAGATVAESGAVCLLAIGGGSTTGLAKALALRTGLPIIAVPTTYAGSEMTPIWGMTEGGVKTTGRDARVLPRLVIYDPDLLTTLPPEVVATSGMNAIAHCVEALYSQTANPVTSLMAEEGIRAIAEALPRAARSAVDKRKPGRKSYTEPGLAERSRRCRDGPPPQALSHARRQLRSSPRRGSYDHHSACDCIQHSGCAGCHVARR